MELRQLGKLMQEARRRANQHRKEKGLKVLGQQEIADKLQVNKQTVSKWERGEIEPGARKLYEYCKELDVTLDELFGVKKNAFCNM